MSVLKKTKQSWGQFLILLSLAARNLKRNRRRSLATLVAIAIGSTAILLFGGFSENINLEMHTRIVKRGGHLQIQHRDFYLYGSGNPAAYSIKNYIQIIEDIKSDPVLKNITTVVTPTLQFGAIAGNSDANVSRTIMGYGFVAGDVNKMRLWNDFNLRSIPPVFELQGSASDSAIVGVGVARVLQLCEALKISHCKTLISKKETPTNVPAVSGSEIDNQKPKVDILIVSSQGSPNVTSLNIIKAEDQGIKELDEIVVLMHLEKIQQLIYGGSEPKVTAINIQLQKTSQIDQAMTRLMTILEKYSTNQKLSINDFRSLNPFFVQTEKMFHVIFGFVFLLIGGIVLFTVANTMNTAVTERTVEVGTLRTIGLRQNGIRRLFVIEGALIGIVGAMLGAVMAMGISLVVNRLDIPWLPPGNVDTVPLTIRVVEDFPMIMKTTFGLIIVGILSAWLPAYRAAKLDVVDALRHV